MDNQGQNNMNMVNNNQIQPKPQPQNPPSTTQPNAGPTINQQMNPNQPSPVPNQNQTHNVTPTSVTNQTPDQKKYGFNSEEKVIYKIKEEKDSNPIGTLFIILLLIGVVVFLPTIAKKLGSIKTAGFGFANTNENAQAETEEDDSDKRYSFYDSTNAAKIGDLTVSQLGTSKNNDDYVLTFTMINKSEEPFLFDKKYYVHLYSTDGILIYRALIYSFETLGAHASKEFKFNIPPTIAEKAKSFNLKEIEPGKYSDVTLNVKEGDYYTYTCTYQNNKLKYYFKDGYLEKIYETYEENSLISLDFYYKRDEARKIVNNYSSLGFDSHIDESFDPDAFTLVNNIELLNQDYNLSKIKQYKYFKYGTESKVVAFEMQALAYTCS